MAGDYYQQLLENLFGQQDQNVAANAKGAERPPYPSEQAYFQANPQVAGMATEDRAVIMNPNTGLASPQQDAVRMNEYARLFMQSNPQYQPNLQLTPDQQKAFAQYGPPEAQQQTLIARIISGDPSAGQPTPEQLAWANYVQSGLKAWRQ